MYNLVGVSRMGGEALGEPPGEKNRLGRSLALPKTSGASLDP